MSTNPHLAPRTIREWLELIPFDRARKEAIENFEQSQKENIVVGSLTSAFICLEWGTWLNDYESHLKKRGYWGSIYCSLYRMEQSVKLKQKDHGASFGIGY